MDNFETLRKDWNSLEAGAGSGDGGLLRPGKDAFIFLARGGEGDTFWLYPDGGENRPMTMRELLALGALDKVPIFYSPDLAAYVYVYFYVRTDESWTVRTSKSNITIDGANLDSELKSEGPTT